MGKREFTNSEMIQGFLDGAVMDNPEPSENRSHSYRHGFRAARIDRGVYPRWNAEEARTLAKKAMMLDEQYE